MRVPALALMLLFALSGAAADAQTSKSATLATKPAAKTARKPPAKPAEPPLEPADDLQKVAAEAVIYGEYQCEFNQTVRVVRDPKHPAYVDVRYGKASATMKPMKSVTGALRLEDVKDRWLMVQIASKSMLMDVQAGRRLVDGCVSEIHRAAAASAPPSNLGIEPPKEDAKKDDGPKDGIKNAEAPKS